MKFRLTAAERARYEALASKINQQRADYFKRSGFVPSSLENHNDFDFVNFAGRKPKALERIETRREFTNRLRRIEMVSRTGWNTPEIRLFKKNLIAAIEDRFGPKGENMPREWLDKVERAVNRLHYKDLERISNYTHNLIAFTYFESQADVFQVFNNILGVEED